MDKLSMSLNLIDVKIRAHLERRNRQQELYNLRTKLGNQLVDIREELSSLEGYLSGYQGSEIADEEAIVKEYIRDRVAEFKVEIKKD